MRIHVLQLTKRTEYGLIALIHIAGRVGQVVSVREIGEHYPLPRRLLAEVLKDLGRAGLVESQRGATGGYVLTRSAREITVGDVVVALEGAPVVTVCESADPAVGNCGVEPVCPIRSPLHRLREGIWHLMERTTLESLRSQTPFIELAGILPLERVAPALVRAAHGAASNDQPAPHAGARPAPSS